MTGSALQEALRRLQALEKQLLQAQAELSTLKEQIRQIQAAAPAPATGTEAVAENIPATEPVPLTDKPEAVHEAPPPLSNAAKAEPIPTLAATRSTAGSRANFELLLGRHVFDKIALVALLLAGSFFLKVAFERGWISDAVKIIMGTMVGVGLLVWSEFLFLKGMKRYASVIAASGFGLLFLTVYGGLYLYRLFPPWLAFSYLLVATAALVLQAVRHDSQALAVWSLWGAGFAPQIMAGFYPDPGILIRGETFPATRQPFTLQVPYLFAINIAYSWLVFRRHWPLVRFGLLMVNMVTILGWEADLANRWWMATLLWILAAMFVAPAYTSLLPFTRKAPADEGLQPRFAAPALVWRNLHLITTALAVCFFFIRLHNVNEQVETVDSQWVTFSFALLTACGAFAHRLLGNSRHVSLLSIFTAVFLYFFCAQAWRGWKLTLAWLLLCTALHAVRTGGSATARFKPLGAWFVFVSALVYAILRGTPRGTGISLARALFLNEKAVMLALTVAAGLLLHIWLRSRGESFSRAYLISTLLLGWYWIGHLVEQYVHHRTDWFLSYGTSALVRMSMSVAWSIYGAGLMAIGALKRNAAVRKIAMGILLVTILKVFLYDVSGMDTLYRFISFLVLSVVLYGVSYAYNRLGKRLGL